MKTIALLLSFLAFSAHANEPIQDTIIRLMNPYVQERGVSQIVMVRDSEYPLYIGGMNIENNNLQIIFGSEFESHYSELNQDGFAAIICHEIGHFLADRPSKINPKMAGEGQSDYFSTAVCLKKLFRELGSLPFPNVQPIVKANCDEVYKDQAERNVCYRTAEAGLHLMEQHSVKLAVLGGVGNPFYKRYDLNVKETNFYTGHPSLQCRAETLVAGAWCKTAESAFENNRPWACKDGIAARPSCWFREETKASK